MGNIRASNKNLRLHYYILVVLVDCPPDVSIRADKQFFQFTNRHAQQTMLRLKACSKAQRFALKDESSKVGGEVPDRALVPWFNGDRMRIHSLCGIKSTLK